MPTPPCEATPALPTAAVGRIGLIAAGSLIGAAVALDLAHLRSFVGVGLLALALTAALALRWRHQLVPERPSLSEVAAVALILIVCAGVFVRKHDRSLLPVTGSSDLAHNLSSASYIRGVQRPLRSSDATKVALPDLASYPVTGQYTTAFVSWGARMDVGRAAEIVSFLGLSGLLFFLWATGAILAGGALNATGLSPGVGRALVPWLGFIPVAIALATPVFGIEMLTKAYFQAQTLGMAALAYGMFLLCRDASGAPTAPGEHILAEVLVVYSYVQYAFILPFAHGVLFLIAWRRHKPTARKELAITAAAAGALALYLGPRLSSNANNLATPGAIMQPTWRTLGGSLVLLVIAGGVVAALVLLLLRRAGSSVAWGPVAVATASFGQWGALVVLRSSRSPIHVESSSYYRIKNIFSGLVGLQATTVLPVVMVIGLLGAKRQANAPRRWPTAGLAGAALVGVVAAVVIPGTGDSYGKRKLVFDANTYLAARWAGRHLDPNKVDSLEVGFPGYLYTVGELGRLGGSTSALRFSGSYPSDIWLGDVDRRYLVTSDLDALKGTLGARLTPSIRVLHRVGKAAVIDRGAATPWYRAALRVIGSPKRTGSEFVTSVHVRNSGLGAWPAESEGEQGAIRLGAKIIRPDGSEVVEARSPIQRSPTLVTAPGESRTVDIRVPVPPPGTYTLIVDMVWEHIMWFNPKFDRALEFPLVVRANAPH